MPREPAYPARPLRRAAALSLLLGLIGLSSLSGCMTLDHLTDPDQRLRMYGGTQSAWKYLGASDSPFFGSLIRLVDLPLTAVGDTLILPIVAPVVMSRGD